MNEIPKIAVLLETSREYGRSLLRGIIRYARLHGPWTLVASPGHIAERLPPLGRTELQGIIGPVVSARVAHKIQELGLPTIATEARATGLRAVRKAAGLAEIRADSAAIARMAAEHLLERGFQHFGFCGLCRMAWSDARRQAFSGLLTEAGFSCHVYPLPQHRRDERWEREMPAVVRWLRGLPKPAGVMVCNDDRGLRVLRACRAAGLQVPEEIAVVGVDDDDLVCELCNPPLSSVSMDLENAGYAAAELLDRMMAGREVGFHEIVIRPTWVTTRRSSDVVAQDDRLVSDLLRFIRDNASRPIGVPDIIERSQVSRRTLERRFVEAIGRSIHDEITRCRLERAKRLLRESESPMSGVAVASGFPNVKPMVRAFRQFENCSPWEYRKASQGENAR